MRLDPLQTRAYITQRSEQLRTSLNAGEPTTEMLDAYRDNLEQIKQVSHMTDRNTIHLARLLGMRIPDLKTMFTGKSVLDIGCGEGKLAQKLSELPGTTVVALDHDEHIISKIEPSNNLQPILGSGIDLPDEIADEKFDVVLSSFSSVHWAESPKERAAAVQTAIGASAGDGLVVLVPVVTNPRYTQMALDEAMRVANGGKGGMDPYEALRTLQVSYVGQWMELETIDTLLGLESSGEGLVDFRSSSENAERNLLHEYYSAVVSMEAIN